MESNSKAGFSQSLGHPGQPTFSKVEKPSCMHLSPSIFEDGGSNRHSSVYRSFPTHTFRIRPSEGISIISQHQLRTTRSQSLVCDSGVSPRPQLLEQSHLGADVYEVVVPRAGSVDILPACSLTVTCSQARMLVVFRPRILSESATNAYHVVWRCQD